MCSLQAGLVGWTHAEVGGKRLVASRAVFHCIRLAPRKGAFRGSPEGNARAETLVCQGLPLAHRPHRIDFDDEPT
jgi:hypothetical protein